MRGSDTFLRAYFEAALWSTNDESDERGGRPLDENYDVSDIDEDARKELEEEALQFLEENEEDIGTHFSQAGHDFWLTRNGHGAGFWDGDWPEPAATKLTEAAKDYGEVYLDVDEGKIYATFSGRRKGRRSRGLGESERESLYDVFVAAGIPVDHHESDLYVLDTPESRRILFRFPTFARNAKTFRSDIDGKMWFDIPFGYEPFWREKQDSARARGLGEGEEDAHKVDALDLYIENEGPLYELWKRITAQLAEEVLDGKYTRERALRAYRLLVDRGAREYAPEYARELDETAKPWTRTFSIFVRDAVAKRNVDDFEVKFKGGELLELPQHIKARYERAIRKGPIAAPWPLRKDGRG